MSVIYSHNEDRYIDTDFEEAVYVEDLDDWVSADSPLIPEEEE